MESLRRDWREREREGKEDEKEINMEKKERRGLRSKRKKKAS